MATQTGLPELLDSLRQSIDSVSETVPTLSGLAPSGDGVSLLDVKNELLLSYLEHLVFLILLKLRNAASGASSKSQLDLEHSELGQSVVQKLVELRVYLEKGVRPLEEKLRFQIERALHAADNAERRTKAAKPVGDSEEDEDEAESDAESGSAEQDEDEDEGDEGEAGSEEEEAAPSRMRTTDDADGENVRRSTGTKATGVYKPPKRLSAIMPGTVTATTGNEWSDRKERRTRTLKSSILDEFVADEYSTTPTALPSIGTNIGNRGRHMKTDNERRREDERRDYEETNYVRLPKESKKARAKAEGAVRGRMSFGGEEWRDIGDGVDRINELTRRRKSGGANSARAIMEKSRKRGRDTLDGPRSSGTSTVSMGNERFNKRAKNQR